MLRRDVALATATIAATATLLGAPLPAAAAPLGGPWGPPHVLYDGRPAQRISQATTTDGTTVVAFQRNPRHGPRSSFVAIQRSGGTWSEPAPLSDRRTIRPKVLAWGAGHLSVIWSSPVGPNNYRYHLRSLNAEGTLGEAERLVKAKYAFRMYQAAMNSHGQVALAWSNGNRFDRVVVRHVDGSWARYPRVPVRHARTYGFQVIEDPRALFLDDAGRVSIITWGSVDDSSKVIWLARPGGDDGWTTQRIESGRTPYGYLDAAAYASNPRGDLVVTWAELDASGEATVQLRFAPDGEELGEPTTLPTNWCYLDVEPCAGVAIGEDGTVTVAYGRGPGRGDIVAEMVRRAPDGTFTPAQTLSESLLYVLGLQVAGNLRGDAVVSFYGYDGASSCTAFARCPAKQPCAETLWRDDDRSRLDLWTTVMGVDAEVTVTWWMFGHDGIATRQLAAAG